jgi:purine-binding chemotaxis protein CheW
MNGGKYLTFGLGNEGYGIPIRQVREIIGMMEITPIPKTPVFIKGIINLRGKIVPVVDLRLKFGLPEQPYSDRTCIIVVEIQSGGQQRLFGLVVDMVLEVVNVQAGDVEPPEQYDSVIDGKFMTGIGKLKNKVIVLLEMDQMLAQEELTSLKETKGVVENA